MHPIRNYDSRRPENVGTFAASKSLLRRVGIASQIPVRDQSAARSPYWIKRLNQSNALYENQVALWKSLTPSLRKCGMQMPNALESLNERAPPSLPARTGLISG